MGKFLLALFRPLVKGGTAIAVKAAEKPVATAAAVGITSTIATSKEGRGFFGMMKDKVAGLFGDKNTPAVDADGKQKNLMEQGLQAADDAGLTFGLGSVALAGAGFAAGYFGLESPMIGAGLAVVGGLVGQPLLESIVSYGNGGVTAANTAAATTPAAGASPQQSQAVAAAATPAKPAVELPSQLVDVAPDATLAPPLPQTAPTKPAGPALPPQ